MRWLVLALLLAGCASAEPQTARERTVNDQVLAFDAAKDAGGDPGCRDRKIVGAEITRPFQAGSQLPAGQWSERWTVDRCGAIVPYQVNYMRAVDGHLAITVVRESSVADVLIGGATLADHRLQHDTFALLTQKDLSDTEGQPCRLRRVTDTEVVSPVAGKQVENGKPVAGEWVERWTLDRCGAPVRYIVRFTTHRSGTTFTAEREP